MHDKADKIVERKHFCQLLVFLTLILIMSRPSSAALENHFLYFPVTLQEQSPHTVGLDYEEIHFQSDDGLKLNGWLVHGQKNAPVILFCMGNAGNISHRLETLLLLNRLGASVFIFNYRGYGKSHGKPSEKGLYSDVIAATRVLKNKGWGLDQIIIFGRSLGAAIGLEAALQTRPAGLIMEAAFTSVQAMGRYHYPILNFFFGWLIDAEFNNLEKISSLKSPLILIHGADDKICPPQMAEKLISQAPNVEKIHWIVGAGHNDSLDVGGDYYKSILEDSIKAWTGFSLAGPSVHKEQP